VDPWYAHDFVPFEQGEDFAFLGGMDWDPSQASLPAVITDACEILLIGKDSLAGYHRELVEHFILEDKWGRWIGRWTAEEHLHAIALREYLIVTREIDPDANESVRMTHVQKGYRADRYSQVETLVFMAFYERACAEFCRNLADKTDEPVLKGLIGRIAGDEERHEEFFANLITHCLDYVPEETVAAIAARAAELKVVGADIDAYADRQAGIAEAGIFGPDHLRRVISDRISAWGLAAHPDLKSFVLG
jgi:acyl-[acyl-carrier-protein] desaturase